MDLGSAASKRGEKGNYIYLEVRETAGVAGECMRVSCKEVLEIRLEMASLAGLMTRSFVLCD